MPHRRYLDPYRRSQARHGPAFEVTLWASQQSQERRFGVFTQMCFLAGKRILDAGCSRGDLAAYLLRHDVAYAHYVGIDALEEVIAFASRRKLPNAEFHCGDFAADPTLLGSGAPQVVCLSGTLNTMDDAHVMSVLEGAWAGAGQTLLFNFLSARCGPGAPRQDPPVRRMDPLRLLDWALSKTSQASLRQDYFPDGHDATIGMHKPADNGG